MSSTPCRLLLPDGRVVRRLDYLDSSNKYVDHVNLHYITDTNTLKEVDAPTGVSEVLEAATLNINEEGETTIGSIDDSPINFARRLAALMAKNENVSLMLEVSAVGVHSTDALLYPPHQHPILDVHTGK